MKRIVYGLIFVTCLGLCVAGKGLLMAAYVPLPDTDSYSNIGIGTFAAHGGKLIIVNGNVGIGSLSPGQALDVTGTLKASVFLGDASLVSGSASGFTDSGSQVLTTLLSDNVGIGTSKASTGKLMVYGGNVGIGTVSQVTAAMLHVSSKAAQDLLRVDDNGDGDASPFVIDSVGAVAIGTSLPGTAKLAVASGNVGINTNNPGAYLDVVSDANGSEGIAAFRSLDKTKGFIFSSNTISQVNATAQTTFKYHAAFGGGLYIGNGWMYIQTSHKSGHMYIFSSGVSINTSTPQGVALAVLGVSSFGTWNMSTTGGTYINGNLGIGTSIAKGGLIVFGGNVGIGSGLPQQPLVVNNNLIFATEYNNGTCAVGGTVTVTWANGQQQLVTLSNGAPACTINFSSTLPGGVAAFRLRIISGGVNSSVNFGVSGATIHWPSGVAPTITASAGKIDIITCYHDSAEFYCYADQNF